MDRIIPISDLQSKTKELIESVKRSRDPIVITQRGRPAAMVVNFEEYEGMLHSLEEMSYPDWQDRLKEAERDSKLGRGILLKELKKKIDRRRSKSIGHR
jgi:prevent-host-death family protein